MTSVTEEVGRWIAGVDDLEVPAAARDTVRRITLDSIGAMAAGAATPTGDRISRYAASLGGGPESTIVGRAERVRAPHAALANGTMGHVLELDDWSHTMVTHPANPLVAAILALGEVQGSTGRELTSAAAVGWEIGARVSPAITQATFEAGWHAQGFQPALVAAAACAKLRDLDADRCRMVLGMAGSMCAGLHVNRGSDTKSFHAGSAARAGVTAVELVAAGFTANADIFDGEIGFCRVVGGPTADPGTILEGLGTWDIATVGSCLKRYASCGGSHYAIEAVAKILDEVPIDAAEIAEVECHVPAGVATVLPYHLPQSGLEAKFSLEYGVATMVLHHAAGLEQFTDDHVRSPAAQDLMGRTRYVLDPAVPTTVPDIHRYPHRVVLRLRDGRELTDAVNGGEGKGQPANPLSWDELTDKFHECADRVLAADARKEIVAIVEHLDDLDDVRSLTALLRAGKS